MIPALCVLLSLQLIGEVVTRGLGLPLPGPVLGLLLLVAGCALRPSLAQMLRPVTSTILGNLSLFFVPAGVGVVAHLQGVAWPVYLLLALTLAALGTVRLIPSIPPPARGGTGRGVCLGPTDSCGLCVVAIQEQKPGSSRPRTTAAG